MASSAPGNTRVRERVVQEELRGADRLRIARPLDSKALEGAEVVGVTVLAPQLLEDGPVALLPFGAERVEQMALEVGDDRVVVEQRVVDVNQVNEVPHGRIVRQRPPPSGRT